MKPYLFPAAVVGVVALIIGGWLAGLGFFLAIFYYGKFTYCEEQRADSKLLKETRQMRFDTTQARAYTKRYP